MTESQLTTEYVVRGGEPTEAEMKRIEHQVEGLARRVKHYPDPRLHAVLERHVQQRRVTAEFRLQLGPLGPSLMSHQAAETADRAAKLAIDDLERQLERHLARQRGEASYGVPSRRKFTPPPAPQTPETGGE
jgi:ribosome-associated translation inhibitor RaiA